MQRANIEIKIPAKSQEMRLLIANAMNSLSSKNIDDLKKLGVQIPEIACKIPVEEFAKLLPHYRRVWLNSHGEIAYYNGCMPCEDANSSFKVVAYKIFERSPRKNLAGEIECFALSCIEFIGHQKRIWQEKSNILR